MEGLKMYLQTTFELMLALDTEKFQKLLAGVYDTAEYSDEDEYVDRSMVSKGITVVYRDSQYKKKVKLIVNTAWVLDSDEPEPGKLIRKLEKRIDDYFGSKYRLNDFTLTGLRLSTDIDVRDREKAAAYIKVLQRVGKIKGFSPSRDNRFGDDICFCLEGNSNGTEFMICDLEGLLREQMKEKDTERKQLKDIIKKSEGLLRVEVRLTNANAIHDCTDETVTSEQIADLSANSENIFLKTFMRVVPFGDFYKKGKAVELIMEKVSDVRLRRRCLRLLVLIPEKRSLLLAQKALNYRHIDDVMEAFAMAEVSPVTIGKRHDMSKLNNLYKCM
jgi:hypothetical protein